MNKISIITVTYNCVNTLGDTIKSVNAQTARNEIEFIVIDGQSTDGTIDLLKDKQNEIDHWISEKDSGIYDAMNKGLKIASGQWVGFLHADDMFFSDNVVEEIILEADRSKCNVIYGNLDYISADQPHKVVRHWQSQAYNKKLLKRGWMPAHPTVYIENDHIKTVGFYNTDFKIAADYEYMLRLFQHPVTTSKFIDSTFVNMRLGGVSNNSMKNILRKSKEDYRALKLNKVGGIYALFIKNFSKLIQFVNK